LPYGIKDFLYDSFNSIKLLRRKALTDIYYIPLSRWIAGGKQICAVSNFVNTEKKFGGGVIWVFFLNEKGKCDCYCKKLLVDGAKRNQWKQNEIENGRKINRGRKEIKPIFTITMLDYFTHMSRCLSSGEDRIWSPLNKNTMHLFSLKRNGFNFQ
jgi:hypothetical protein